MSPGCISACSTIALRPVACSMSETRRRKFFRAAVADVVDGVGRVASARLAAAVGKRRAVEDCGSMPSTMSSMKVKSRRISPWLNRLDRAPGEDRVGEQPHRHVGPPPRPVDGEEAQARLRQGEQVGVAFAQQLVGALGRGIERKRPVGALVDRHRQGRAAAIDRGGAGVDEMARPRGAAPARGCWHGRRGWSGCRSPALRGCSGPRPAPRGGRCGRSPTPASAAVQRVGIGEIEPVEGEVAALRAQARPAAPCFSAGS